MMRWSTALAGLSLGITASVAGAQTRPSAPLDPVSTAHGARPLPGPVYEIPEFSRAVQRGSRTRSGRPASGYWVQHARYTIEARLDPATDRVSGSERVEYVNHSPDTLRRLAVHLRQNVFAAGNPRRQSAPITGGVTLGRVSVGGQVVRPKSSGVDVVPITDVAKRHLSDEGGYTVDGTVMWLPLPSPLLPHDSVRLELAWSYSPPPSPSDGRQGREGHHLYFMGYWYPQIAVYDDVNGWVADPYLLEAEFYMDPADYDVHVTVPAGWVVGATGTLANAADVLTPAARGRLADARRGGSVVHVVEPGASAKTGLVTRGATSTWHFVARDVRDFSWGTSDQYVWDATRALVSGDTVNIYSFYRRHAPAAAWALGGARFTRDAIEQLSRYLWAYPWPTMTSMEGVLDSGGMEYPMMTLMQPWADTLSLAGDLMHETGHMWFPMQVGSNETRYPWMDEGFTQFDVAQAMRALYGEPRTGGRPGDSEAGQRALYLAAARSGHDMTLMWPGDLYPQDLYFIMFYDKTAQALAALRGVLGEDTFHRAYREYGRRWLGKHPYPYDFFNTIADVAGRDLSWFWQTWFQRAWPLDQAIASVQAHGDSTNIVVEDRGLAPMPIELAVAREGGAVQRLRIPVDVWLGGARQYVVRVASTPRIERVAIDPDGLYPDVDRDNQVWAGGAVQPSGSPSGEAPPSEWLDATAPLDPATTPVYEGDPRMTLTFVKDLRTGDPLTLSSYALGAHSGTHVDAPMHFVRDGASIDQVPLDRLIGPVRIIDIPDDVQAIGAAELQRHAWRGATRIFFRTRSSLRHWMRSPAFHRDFAYIAPDAAQLLADDGVQLVGIDYLSAEEFGAKEPRAHQILLGRGIPIVEGLDLETVPAGDYDGIVLPLRVSGHEAAPARVALRKVQGVR